MDFFSVSCIFNLQRMLHNLQKKIENEQLTTTFKPFSFSVATLYYLTSRVLYVIVPLISVVCSYIANNYLF